MCKMPSQKAVKSGHASPEQAAGPSDATTDAPADACGASDQPAEDKQSSSKPIPASQFYGMDKTETKKEPDQKQEEEKAHMQRPGHDATDGNNCHAVEGSTNSACSSDENAGGDDNADNDIDGDAALDLVDYDSLEEQHDSFSEDSDPFEEMNDPFEYTDADTDDEDEDDEEEEEEEYVDDDDDDSVPSGISMDVSMISDDYEDGTSDDNSDLPEDPFEREIMGSVVEPNRSLHQAVVLGDMKNLGRWQAWGAGVWARKVKGDTELHSAARSGDVATVEQLIKSGVQLDKTNRKRHTALEVAAMCGHAGVVKTLLRNGAAFDSEQMEHALLATKSSAVVKTLAEECETLLLGVSGIDVLCRSARDGRVFMLRALLAAGADANWPGTFSRTALHTAASRGHVRCVKTLLEYDADVTCVDDRLWTPLHYAAYHCYRECVRVLLAAGANPNARSGEGQTPYDVTFDEAIHRQLENS